VNTRALRRRPVREGRERTGVTLAQHEGNRLGTDTRRPATVEPEENYPRTEIEPEEAAGHDHLSPDLVRLRRGALRGAAVLVVP